MEEELLLSGCVVEGLGEGMGGTKGSLLGRVVEGGFDAGCCEGWREGEGKEEKADLSKESE